MVIFDIGEITKKFYDTTLEAHLNTIFAKGHSLIRAFSFALALHLGRVAWAAPLGWVETPHGQQLASDCFSASSLPDG